MSDKSNVDNHFEQPVGGGTDNVFNLDGTARVSGAIAIQTGGTITVESGGDITVDSGATMFMDGSLRLNAAVLGSDGVQSAAIIDATDAASAITQLNLALAAMRKLGLIVT